MKLSPRHYFKKNKDSSQDFDFNPSSEERKQGSNPYPALKQYFKRETDNNRESSTNSSTKYICLNQGQVVVKGNEIETIVPCEIDHINSNR